MTGFLSRPIPIALIFAALVLSALSAERVFSLIDSLQLDTEIPQQAQSNNSDDAAQINAELVINANLFGVVQDEYVALEQIDEETDLPLKLVGVLAGKEGSSNAAMIELENGQTKLFKVDARIIEGAILKAVYADKVVIAYRGRNQSLAFPIVPMTGIEEDTTINSRVPANGRNTNTGSNRRSLAQDRLNLLRSRNNQ